VIDWDLRCPNIIVVANTIVIIIDFVDELFDIILDIILDKEQMVFNLRRYQKWNNC